MTQNEAEISAGKFFIGILVGLLLVGLFSAVTQDR